MEPIDPYRMSPGPELDQLMQKTFFGTEGELPVPPYSQDPAAADKIIRQLKVLYATPIRTGRTNINGKAWYARFGTDPSTSTEVVAETYPLAICRLALLMQGSDDVCLRSRPKGTWVLAPRL